MLNTIKSFSFVLFMPVLLTICFHSNQIGVSRIERSPAVLEKKESKQILSVKDSVKNYLLAVYVK